MREDLQILLPVQLDPYLVVDHFHKNGTYEEVRDFIVALDETMGDWDFTMMLHEYFEKQYELYMEEKHDFGR